MWRKATANDCPCLLSVIKTTGGKQCLDEGFFYELTVFKESHQLHRLQYVSG